MREGQPTMPTSEASAQRLFDKLQPGDRIEVLHDVKVGLQNWTTRTVGTVVHKERRRHGLHFRRNLDDKVFSDIILLKRDDGELTTITMDEFTELRYA
jgi:hypothetical protein